ncbi:DNA-binding IclR family transcriptional regulator [Amycolatopsis lexingtonensis]|uniref:DNA-binding IclR family transcriptional regulator n=1 Tax=Amycolatopsis lexingtonensis TaxID=218822 RepID=A0ABR9HYB9_9PSEU|nr:helix-turn-helix domain-containing protein [Amycolatopsis lexingtonensis]MBE1495931.1 DNA-binding IclR family transcriptional regulator [Amycolatopsis lexingtonensis]
MLTDGSDLRLTEADAEADAVSEGDAGRARGRSVLAGAFALLEVLADAEAELGLTEAARRAGLPKSTSHRLLEQLCGMGAVEHRIHGYGVGPMFGRLCEGRGRTHAWIRAVVGRPAVRLAKLSRSDVVVGVSSGSEVLVVATFAGHSARLPVIRPGTVLASPTPLVEVLHNGADAAEGSAQTAGLSCAAAPIHAPDGRVVAALGVLNSCPGELARLRRLVVLAAAEAARELTGFPRVH